MSTPQAVLRGAAFIAPRYETPATPCTGVTAVVCQERAAFTEGVFVAPWCPLLPAARDARAAGRVVETGWQFALASGTPVRVLITTDARRAPVLYLHLDGHFAGRCDPYDTPHLHADALAFGLATDALLRAGGAHAGQMVWGADWECVPALLLARSRHRTVLTLAPASIAATLRGCVPKSSIAR
jgi:hypothetical protein